MSELSIQTPEIFVDMFQDTETENWNLWGGRGRGASTNAARKVLQYCTTCEPDWTFVAGRHYEDDVEESVAKQLMIACQEMKLVARRKGDRIYLPVGCSILLTGLNSELNLRSIPKTCGLWFEEAQQATSTQTLANLRATTRRVNRYLYIQSMNRVLKADPAWIAFKRIPERYRKEIYGTVLDNPFASDSVLQEYNNALEALQKGELSQEEFDLVWKGLPYDVGDDNVYRYSDLEEANKTTHDAPIIGCVIGQDLAYGGLDKNVMCLLNIHADGHYSVAFYDWWKTITSSDTKGRLVSAYQQYRPKAIGLDAGDGGGMTMYSELQELGVSVAERFVPGVSLKGGSGMPANLRAKATLLLADKIKARKIHNLPQCFVDDMAEIRKHRSGEGAWLIEKKEDMRKRIHRSPDFHDALAIACYYADKLFKETSSKYSENVVPMPKLNIGMTKRGPTIIRSGGKFARK